MKRRRLSQKLDYHVGQKNWTVRLDTQSNISFEKWSNRSLSNNRLGRRLAKLLCSAVVVVSYLVITAANGDQSELTPIQTGLDLEESKSRCLEKYTESVLLFSNDLQWHLSPTQMNSRFKEIYNSGKRLPLHSTYEIATDQFFLHLNRGAYFKIPVTMQFISNVVLNIEQAIQFEYADFVFMSDLGHTHLYFPQEHWNKKYKNSNATIGQLYEQMLSDPLLRPLYHGAEQLQFPNDTENTTVDNDHSIKRYSCRNILGSNDGSNQIELHHNDAHPRNTVFELDGYKRYSAGFQISASKYGCFGYRDRAGTKLYFDIGLTDLQQDPKYGIPCEI